MVDELAEVVNYSGKNNAYTVVTRGSGGRPSQPSGRMLRDIPRKTDSPGNVSPLPAGTSVIINWDLGFPYISGALPVNVARKRTEARDSEGVTVSGSKSSVVSPEDQSEENNSLGYFRAPGTPKDLLEGDQVLSTPDGNFIGALRGNYSVLTAGPDNKAKVEAFGDRDLLRFTCETLELFTGFGEISFYNTEGRCGLSIKAGADQLAESGGEEEQWTFKLDIGETGEFVTMEVCDTSGNTKAKLNITQSGKVEWLATDGYNIANAGKGTSTEEHAGAIMRRVLGQVTDIIGQNKTERISGSLTAEISESENRTVGHNHNLTVNNSQYLNVGGNQVNTITGGSPLTANPLNVAVETQVLNGSYFLEVGNPLAGANPAALAGITLAVNNGSVTLGQNPSFLAPPAALCSVNLNTRLPHSVALGGTTNPISTNPAFFHAVMFEPLLAVLTAMIAAHDTHFHILPLTPCPVPSAPIITPLLATIMSLRVLIGG